MRILQIAPPWFPVPPTGYGGIEWIVSSLADGLTALGHDVTLVANGDSETSAELVSVFDGSSPQRLGDMWMEAAHAVAAYVRSGEFDVIHDHTGVIGCGSVWPHDTAIAAWELVRTGRAHESLTLIRGLVDAAPWFDYRLPELFAGFAAEDTVTPVPYPAACRPQAWASASTLLMMRSLLVAEADVPGGTLTLRPISPLPCARIALTGLNVGGGTVDVTVDEGAVSVQVHDTSVSVAIEAGR